MRAEHLEFVERVNEKRFTDNLWRRPFTSGLFAAAGGAARTPTAFAATPTAL